MGGVGLRYDLAHLRVKSFPKRCDRKRARDKRRERTRGGAFVAQLPVACFPPKRDRLFQPLPSAIRERAKHFRLLPSRLCPIGKFSHRDLSYLSYTRQKAMTMTPFSPRPRQFNSAAITGVASDDFMNEHFA